MGNNPDNNRFAGKDGSIEDAEKRQNSALATVQRVEAHDIDGWQSRQPG